MALGTEEATYNAAVDTLIAAWVTVVDAMAASEETQIVFMRSKKGDSPGNSSYGAPGAGVYDFNKKYYVKNFPDVTGDTPLEVANIPLFWKITNLAGDLT